MPDLTTIKVPRELRDRVSSGALHRGLTAAGLIAELLDRYERDQRLASVGKAYAEPVDPVYRDETEAWDVTGADGLA